MPPIIKIDQAGLLPAGVPGKSRSDGKLDGSLVTITNVGGGAVQALLLRWIADGDALAVPSFANPAPGVWTFSPTPDAPGTYELQLTVDGETVIRTLKMRTANLALLMPGLNETGDAAASLQNKGASVVDASMDNEDEASIPPGLSGLAPTAIPAPFSAGNYASWYRLLRDIGIKLEDMSAGHSPSGFQAIDSPSTPKPLDSEVTLDDPDSPFTFTLDTLGAATFWDVFFRGKRSRFGAALNVNLVAADSTQWIAYDVAGAVLAITSNPTPSQVASLMQTQVPVAVLVVDDTGEGLALVLMVDARHSVAMEPAEKAASQLGLGTLWVDGLLPGGFDVDGDGSLDAHAQFDLTDGTAVNQDQIFTVTDGFPSADPQALTPVLDVVRWLFRSGPGTWRRADGNPAFPTNAITTFPAYNANGTTTQLPADGEYVLATYFAVKSLPGEPGALSDRQGDRVIAIVGQAVFTTAISARAAAVTVLQDLDLSGLPNDLAPICTIIIQKNAAFTNAANARIISTASGAAFVDHRQIARGVSGLGTSGGGGGSLQDAYDTGQTIDMQAATGELVINAIDGVAMRIQKGGADVFSMDASGNVSFTPPAGQSFSANATGAGPAALTTVSGLLTISSALGALNVTATTGVLTLSQGAGSAIAMDAVGGIDIAPAAGQELRMSALGQVTRIRGDLVVEGTTVTVDSETVLIKDNHLLLNSGYATASSETGGLVVINEGTGVNDTVAAPGFTAAANPTVGTVGAATYSAGDFVQFNDPANPENGGVYEVLSHAANVLTLKGVPLVDFVQTAFVTDATVQGTIAGVDLSVWRAGGNGQWETANGPTTTGLTFTRGLQAAYGADSSVDVDSTVGTIVFQNTADATDVMQILRSFVGAGDGLNIQMEASTTGRGEFIDMQALSTGDGLHINVAATATGRGLLIDIDGSGAEQIHVRRGGATQLAVNASGDWAWTPDGGFTASMTGGSVASIATVDGNASLATSGTGDAQLLAAGTGAVNIDAAGGEVNFDDVGNSGLTLSQANDRILDEVAAGQVLNGATSAIGALNRLARASTLLGSISGLHIANDGVTPDAIIDIDAGRAASDDGTFQIVSTGTLSPDISAAAGVNSIDTGVVAANLWYAVWVIADTTGVNAPAGLFSLSFTEGGLTFPAGYDVARRVGAVRTDATSDILIFGQPKSPGASRWTYWKESVEIQTTGTATSYTDTATSAATRVPPSAVRQQVGMFVTKLGAGSALAGAEILPDGWNEAAGNLAWRVGVGFSGAGDPGSNGISEMPVGPSRLIRYLVSPAGDAEVTIEVKGWEDAL